jgi:UDP-GlcNAc3NAcA epimerase
VLQSLQASLGHTGGEIAPYGSGDAAARIVKRLSNELV